MKKENLLRRVRMHRLAIALVILMASVDAAVAQRINIDSLREALAEDTSVTELRRREAALASASRTAPEAMLERGMLLLRLYELRGDKKDASTARNVTERATRRTPADARAHYAFGLSNATDVMVRIPSPGGVLDGLVVGQSVAEVIKLDPASKAKRSFRKALELDPNHVGAGLGLAELSLKSRDRDNMEVAARSLREMLERGMGGARAATLLSEVEAALGNLAAASEAANKATGIAANSSALRAQATALLRQSGKHEAGARTYFEGVAVLDANAADEYFQDIVGIASDRERAQWETSDLDARRTMLTKFWDVRAASGGVTVAERLAEHYKRLSTAHERYRRIGTRGSAPGVAVIRTKYSTDNLPFDDRGVILLRHGEPDEMISTVDGDVRPNVTWVYRKGTRNSLFNFVVLRDGTDYRLVDDLLYAVSAESSPTPSGSSEAAARLLRDREKWEPRYAALASRFEAASRLGTGVNSASESGVSTGVGARQRIVSDMRQTALEALETDTHEPDFTANLPFYYDLYSFRGANGTTEVTLGAAIPGTNLSGRQAGPVFIYQLQASLILIDTATDVITRKDTVYTLRSPRLLSAGEYLRLHMKVEAPYSPASTHRVVLRDVVTPGVGQFYGGPADLRGFTGENLMISDIVLAEPGAGNWRRGDAELRLVPPREFSEKQPLRVFYELYNLPPNQQYRTQITMVPVDGGAVLGRITKLFGGGDGSVQLEFDAVTPQNSAGVVQELREVTPEVKPGRYRIVVRVTNLDNQQTVRSETSFILSRKPK